MMIDAWLREFASWLPYNGGGNPLAWDQLGWGQPALAIPVFGLVLGLLACVVIALLRNRLAWGGAVAVMLASLLLATAILDPQQVTQSRQAMPTVMAVIGQGTGDQQEALKSWQSQHSDIEVQQAAWPSGADASPIEELRSLLPASDQLGGVLILPPSASPDISSGGRADKALPPAISRAAVEDLAAWLRQRQLPGHVWLPPAAANTPYRLELLEQPSFGMVGQQVKLTVRVTGGGDVLSSAHSVLTAPLTLVVMGERGQAIRTPITPDVAQTITLPPLSAGVQRYRLSLQEGDQSLSQRDGAPAAGNPQQFLTLHGITQRLRVLLVSNQAWAGGRVWRELLKSDPAVDLVHFTILRRPDSRDSTVQSELSLIPFPVDQLFGQQLNKFDVVIFDQDTPQSAINAALYGPPLKRYVEGGGALLVQMGTSSTPAMQMRDLPDPLLQDLLPARCQSGLLTPFSLQLTAQGQRHPVTKSLPPLKSSGRWSQGCVASVKSDAQAATKTLLQDGAGNPMLVLATYGQGRVAQFLSDDLWQWQRQVDGGGATRPLLQNLVGWLRQEQGFDDSPLQLQSTASDGDLDSAAMGREGVNWRAIWDRGNLSATATTAATAKNGSTPPPPLMLEKPDGTSINLAWQEDADKGLLSAKLPLEDSGVYTVTAGSERRFVEFGRFDGSPTNQPLTALANREAWQNLANSTGGQVFEAATATSSLMIPDAVQLVSAQQPAPSENSLWLRRVEVEQLVGSQSRPLLPLAAWLIPAALLLLLAWRGRLRRL